jgi:hypothetical protein
MTSTERTIVLQRLIRRHVESVDAWIPWWDLSDFLNKHYSLFIYEDPWTAGTFAFGWSRDTVLGGRGGGHGATFIGSLPVRTRETFHGLIPSK